MRTLDTPLKCLSESGTLTVYLEGDIDHHTAQSIRARIDTKLFIKRPEELILDLSGVHFMDSSGLGLILGRFAKATELGVGFKVVNPNEQIRKILDLAGTDRLIRIETTKEME